MSYSNTSILTHTSETTSHGQLSSLNLPEAMDVDTNEGRRAQDKSLLDTTFEEPQLPVTQSDNYDAPATCAPVAIYPPTTILDRPREVDGTLQPLSTQNGKISHRDHPTILF